MTHRLLHLRRLNCPHGLHRTVATGVLCWPAGHCLLLKES